MILSDYFFVVALACAIWSVVSAMVIVSFLSGKGVKINWILIKLYIVKYIGQYHEITKNEEGKPGPWFYSYIISINLALFLGIVGIVLRKAFGA